jgi:putative methionine-R-sulfoxide reductase with GAF domain
LRCSGPDKAFARRFCGSLAPWCSTCRALASHASQPVATGLVIRKRAGMRIDPADLAESIGTLADLDPDRGLARGRDRVVAAATTLFDADTAGLMLLAKDGTLAAASAFDQQGELAELAQAQLGQGPCVEAFTRGVPVAIPDLRADARFDQIGFALRSAGIRGALCVPVEVLGGPIGTLDLFTATPRAWDDSEVAAAHAYGGVVASLLGSAVAAHASSRLAKQLQTALDSRVLIEQAKGVLMASEKVDAQTACTRLRRQARNTRRPVCPRWPGRSSTASGPPRTITDQTSPAAATRSPKTTNALQRTTHPRPLPATAGPGPCPEHGIGTAARGPYTGCQFSARRWNHYDP